MKASSGFGKGHVLLEYRCAPPPSACSLSGCGAPSDVFLSDIQAGLWPSVQQLQHRAGSGGDPDVPVSSLQLDQHFSFILRARSSHARAASDGRFAEFVRTTLKRQCAVLYSGASSSRADSCGGRANPPGLVGLEISIGSRATDAEIRADQSYTLDTTLETALAAGSHAQLQAKTIAGALYGLEAFVQLVRTGCGASVPAIYIQDRPTRQWRGVVVDMDTSTDSASTLEEIVAHMVHVKLNVLHWRLVSPPRADEAGTLQRVLGFASLHGVHVVLGGTDIVDHVLINKTASVCYPTAAASAPDGPAVSHWRPILQTLASSHPRQLVQLGWRRRDSKGSRFMCWSRAVQLLGSVLEIGSRSGRRLLQADDGTPLDQFDDSLAGEWGEEVPDEAELKSRLREEMHHPNDERTPGAQSAVPAAAAVEARRTVPPSDRELPRVDDAPAHPRAHTHERMHERTRTHAHTHTHPRTHTQRTHAGAGAHTHTRSCHGVHPTGTSCR
jgi:hypothetical protein